MAVKEENTSYGKSISKKVTDEINQFEIFTEEASRQGYEAGGKLSHY